VVKQQKEAQVAQPAAKGTTGSCQKKQARQAGRRKVEGCRSSAVWLLLAQASESTPPHHTAI